MATIRPSISVQCTYLEASLPVWLKLSTETYYGASSVRISVLFGKWHCFQTVASWWVSFEGLSFLSTLLYPLHSVCWAEYTLYLDACFRFLGFGLCNCMISVYTHTLSTYCSYPLHLFFRNKRAGELLIFAFLEILPPPAMHACPFPFVFDEYAAPHHSLTCFVAAHISNL